MHTTIRRPGRRFSALAATAAASALVVTSLAAPAMAATADDGPIGKEASDGSWLGPYMTPTEDGDQLGWAVDPGLTEPKADGNTDNYGEPEAWEDLTDEQRLQLVAALYFGDKAVEADAAGKEDVDDEFAEELLGTTDVDDIAAGVAGIISSVSVDKPLEGAVWDPQVLDEDANEVYTNLLNGPETATDVDVSDFEFLLRSPGGEAEGNTRVLITSDMELPWAADDTGTDNAGDGNTGGDNTDEGIVDAPGTVNIETLNADGEPLEGVGYDISKVEDGEVGNPLSRLKSGVGEPETTLFAGTYNLVTTDVPEGMQGSLDENFEVGVGEEVSITVTFSEDADPVFEINRSSETEAPDDSEETTTPDEGSDTEAPAEDQEADEAPVAEVPDDVQRKAPIEHNKKPTGEQDRATIVSVPSGPTGENPLA